MTEKIFIVLYALGAILFIGGTLFYWLHKSNDSELTDESRLVSTSDQDRLATPDEGTV